MESNRATSFVFIEDYPNVFPDDPIEGRWLEQSLNM
jgi:hypothetical protein